MVMGGGRERDGSGSSRHVSRERWSGWTRGTGYQGQGSDPYFNTKRSLQPSKTDRWHGICEVLVLVCQARYSFPLSSP